MTTSEESVAQTEAGAFERAAKVAYRICAEAQHVTLGDKIESAIRAEARVPASGGVGDGEADALRKRVAAYRLLAVNEGWVHRMVDAYGHAEYARQRIAEVDARAGRTIASGYDAQKWLDDHALAASPPAAMDGGDEV